MTGAPIVWDLDGEPSEHSDDDVLAWRSYAQGGRVTSIPRYLETHADRLKARYLSFIYELGATEIDGRSVAQHLDRGDGFSYWWMTHLAEKSPFKSPRIYCCLRLLALEELLQARRPTAVTLASADGALARAMERLCTNLGVAFRWRRARGPRRPILRRAYTALPQFVRGLIVLARHLASRWRLRGASAVAWFGGADAVALCSYFIHLDPAAAAGGRFHSRQWGMLPERLHAMGRRTNWLHHFLASAAVPDAETGLRWVRRFNGDAEREGLHSFVDSRLSVRGVVRALRDWVRLARRGARIQAISGAFYASDSKAWLWPLLREDWQASVSGPVAAVNCLWVALFDAALDAMPHQALGLYLYESQGWERAFLRAWRRHGHGEIIGVQHATVPYWHLYYFDDPRSRDASGRCPLPTPDLIAVNGPAARRAFSSAGFPSDRLAEVEALRYLDLERAAEARRVRRPAYQTGARGGASSPSRVLILGDMIPDAMRRFLSTLEEAAHLLPAGYEFTFKPHPGHVVSMARYPGLRAAETTEALDAILPNFDIALSANSTSAAVDAYAAGLPVVIILDGMSLNLSPLRDEPGVRFAGSASELAEAIQATGAAGATEPQRPQLFCLDGELPRWRRLLGARPR